MPLGKVKDFSVLIGNKPFFDQPVENKQEVYEKIIKSQKTRTKQLETY